MRAFLLALVVLSAFVPPCYIAAALPTLWIIQHPFLDRSATLIEVAGIDVTLVDGVILILVVKLVLKLIGTRKVVVDRPLYFSIAAFFVVNILAILAAGVKFGAGSVFHGFVALTRLATEVAIVPFLANFITTLTQAKRCLQIVAWTMVALGVIQFINFFGASHGITIGEVQGIERGELRYFGPVGDSIGFVLLLGYVGALCAARPTFALLFAGGIVLTAGIGAIIGTAVATALVLLFGLESGTTRAFLRRYLWVFPILVFAGIVAAATIGRPMASTLVDRLSSGRFHQSGGQRLATLKMGVKMVMDNPLTGVGFMSYESSLERYGGKRFFNLAKLDGGTANANNQILQSLTDAGAFGLVAFLVFATVSVRLFWKVSARCEDPFLRLSLRASCLWLLTQLLGNHAAVWLIPSAYVARFLWVLLGITVAIARLLPAPGRTPSFPVCGALRSASP